jgi:hypothetical protein
MEKATIFEGKIKRNVFGSWEDCSPGLYLDTDKIETIFNRYENKNIRITVEILED